MAEDPLAEEREMAEAEVVDLLAENERLRALVQALEEECAARQEDATDTEALTAESERPRTPPGETNQPWEQHEPPIGRLKGQTGG